MIIGTSYKLKVGNDSPRETDNGIYVGTSVNNNSSMHYVFIMSEKSIYGVTYDNLFLDMGDPILDAINVYYMGNPPRSVKFYFRKKEDIISITSLKDEHIIKLIDFYA